MRQKRRDILKIILFIGFAAFGLISLMDAGFAQTAEIGELGDAAYKELAQDNVPPAMSIGEMGDEPEGIAFQNWRGFAIKEKQSYATRVSIESVWSVGPMCIRRLLASNMTLDEVKREIFAKEENVSYRGHLRLGESIFQLTKIKVTPKGDNLTLDADISLPKNDSTPSDSAEVMGHLTVNSSRHEGTMNGIGEIIMTIGPRTGSYKVLLNMPSPSHPPMPSPMHMVPT